LFSLVSLTSVLCATIDGDSFANTKHGHLCTFFVSPSLLRRCVAFCLARLQVRARYYLLSSHGVWLKRCAICFSVDLCVPPFSGRMQSAQGEQSGGMCTWRGRWAGRQKAATSRRRR
jgi:hypothetical protein